MKNETRNICKVQTYVTPAEFEQLEKLSLKGKNNGSVSNVVRDFVKQGLVEVK